MNKLQPKMKKLLLIAAACMALYSCDKNENTSQITTRQTDFDGCTPMYVGTSTALDEVTEGLTLYKTENENEWFIPYFFSGAQGEVDFLWDQKTNELTLEESYTGVDNDYYPIYIIAQNKYKEILGVNASASYYNPVSKTFTFNVILEMVVDSGEVYRKQTVLKFQITGNYTKQ